ncbi:hypothetical protein ANCCAN_04648 [Ancylostoma caninum]|uniref:Phlebovirus glycoprotein G2 fusion domain-containing protein n=1 Tax=Ancylostoma caninum TaxID=29170 RepID=A0A368GXZ8_ANCCA|nr:hypothetical protein ANCCAN_04648 [Ancylostoma caninum]
MFSTIIVLKINSFKQEACLRLVIDSKRCPHMGSCIGNKCADVNSTSLIPELEIGNSFPGRTACLESCGGPGCDCFYLSSGCLFYKIYAIPTDSKVTKYSDVFDGQKK